MTHFLRLLAEDHKAEALRQVCAHLLAGATDPRHFEVAPEAFDAVPGKPFAYWVSEAVRETFRRLPAFESEGRMVKQGLATADDFRFLRAWWEAPSSPALLPEGEWSQSPSPFGRGVGVRAQRWFPFAKGGSFSPFYADVYLCVNWGDGGREISNFCLPGSDRVASRPQNTHLFLRPGLTWPARPHRRGAFSSVPLGCIFSHTGTMLFLPVEQHWAYLALLNSDAYICLLHLLMPRGDGESGQTLKYEIGYVKSVSLPESSKLLSTRLPELARRAWSLKRTLDTLNETSHAFLLPAGLNEQITGLDAGAIERELEMIQARIDEIAFTLYGISPEDAASQGSGQELDVAGDDEGDEASGDDTDSIPDPWHLTSWLVGVAFGRFDPRLATGERAIPPEPEPFEPLPSRSPGMVPPSSPSAPWRLGGSETSPDILVDDPGHADDLVARVHTIAERVRVDVPDNLGAWLAKAFFPLHIKMYSKSRRKAPIYWQLATPSASYSVWLYIHASSKDTLFRVQNDYAAPKLAHEERRLESLTSELRDGATAAQRKTLAAQEAFVDELRAFVDEVKRVAPLWKPNLDDGVIINFAPLWRLVPQNKSWQKELKSTWDALCEGKYDWAHLAMHLWPERVVPKCAKDRSLAIAHDLESVFWSQDSGGKWNPRPDARDLIPDLVAERTSPAVKSALKSLLEAGQYAVVGRRSSVVRRQPLDESRRLKPDN